MAVRNLQFVLSGSDKSASKALGKVGKKADGLASKLSGLGKAAAFGVAGAAGALGGGLVVALAKGVQGASDLAESQSKVNVVFGESATVIRKFSNTAARDLGMTRQAALEATGTFGNLFSALGIGVKPAADMSKRLVTLATDLGSFNNVDSEEALLALRSGLLGEAEPLRKFGVSLSAARIESEAFALGLVKPVKDRTKITAAHNAIEAASLKVAAATKKYGKDSLQTRQALDGRARAEAALEKAMKGQKVELTAAQKAQAAYAVILKDTKVAQGDFARTSGGLANQSKILKAQLSDTATSIGAQLLPVLTQAATFVNDEVVPAVNRFIDQFVRGVGPGGEFRDTVSDLGAKARDAAPHIKDAYEKTKTVVDFVIEHKDAFVTITAGVAAYRTAMKSAAVWSAIMGTNGPKAAAGMTAAGTAAALNAPKVATLALALSRAAGAAGLLAGAYYMDEKDGPVRSTFNEFGSGFGKIGDGDILGGLQDILLGDSAPKWLGGNPGNAPSPRPAAAPPRGGGGSSLDRPVKNVTPSTATFPRKGQTAGFAVSASIKVGQRELSNATTDYQGGRLVRGYVPAY